MCAGAGAGALAGRLGRAWRLGRAVEQVGGERGRELQARGGGAQAAAPHALSDHAPAQLHQWERLRCNKQTNTLGSGGGTITLILLQMQLLRPVVV